ncbi:MAG: hypothetical protein HC898_12870, partial [Phycisphaerales bacterium]|nr:hypothetical protein [Phycisphaerales bacterium]
MLEDGATVTNAVTFSNTGGVTLGNGGDTFDFTGGLVSTASTTTVNGDVSTTDTDLTLGTTTVNGNSTLSSGTGLLTLGNTTLADDVT